MVAVLVYPRLSTSVPSVFHSACVKAAEAPLFAGDALALSAVKRSCQTKPSKRSSLSSAVPSTPHTPSPFKFYKLLPHDHNMPQRRTYNNKIWLIDLMNGEAVSFVNDAGVTRKFQICLRLLTVGCRFHSM